MKVKICGITTLDDTLAAVEAGADLLGFNFYPPSPRSLTPAACAGIQAGLRNRGLRPVTVGVFVNHPGAEILAVLEGCGLDAAQLSGDEDPAVLEALGGRAFKAIRPREAAAARAEAERFTRRGPRADGLPALLVDAYHPGQYGGTGQVGDWEAAAGLAARMPLLLAGGLNPENVARAVAQ
jgi:phosphoribosylanthranilate isomerase